MAILADAATIETVTTALTNGVSTIGSQAMSGISSVIPVALPIMGAIVIVRIGIKVFKTVTS